MKVVLLDPTPENSIDPPIPVLPLGIACIAAVAQSFGADVRVFWGCHAIERFSDYLEHTSIDLLGCQTFINNVDLCERAAELVKSKNPASVVVFGGIQASNFPDDILKCSKVDCVISGEGEKTFHQLLTLGVSEFRKCPGIIWRNEQGEVIKNIGGGIVENLDDLPSIPYPLFYGDPQIDTPLVRAHLLTHRGCPHHCAHCPLKFRAGISVRAHSAARIINQIKALQQDYKVSYLEFFDENFTGHPKLVREISAGIKSLGLKWSCTARVSELDLDLARCMAESGCKEIVFGLGTGVPRLQQLLKTNENLEYARSLMAELAQIGIIPIAVFSLGLPTETPEETNITIKYALSLNGAKVRCEYAAPLPGTLLYEYARSNGRFMIHSWNDYVRPGQLIYLPSGWTPGQLRRKLLMIRWRARLKYLIPWIKRRFAHAK